MSQNTVVSIGSAMFSKMTEPRTMLHMRRRSKESAVMKTPPAQVLVLSRASLKVGSRVSATVTQLWIEAMKLPRSHVKAGRSVTNKPAGRVKKLPNQDWRSSNVLRKSQRRRHVTKSAMDVKFARGKHGQESVTAGSGEIPHENGDCTREMHAYKTWRLRSCRSRCALRYRSCMLGVQSQVRYRSNE